jgi:nucleoside-diphosphate-sugar epimerase
MKVLLTGPTGFIGRHAVRHLLASGYDVHTVDIRPIPGNAEPSVTHHTADLLDASQIRDLIAQIRPTHLLHFAWYVTPGKFWTARENLRWLQSSLDLLDSFLDSGGQRSVIAGTCAEYDWTGCGVCVEEQTPIRPSNLYGACKASLQMLQAQLSASSGAAWGRIFHLYGPHEHPSRFVPSVIRPLLRAETAACTHGSQVRDFMHVDDVASAFVALLNSSVSGPVNIASGSPTTIAQIAEQIARLIGRPDLLSLGALPASAGDPPRLVADTRKFQGIGFTPVYTLKEGLSQTVEWWKTAPED